MANAKCMKVVELELVMVAVVVMAMGSMWMGAIGGMQIGVRWEQVGQAFSRWVSMAWVFVVWLCARLTGYGGMSTGAHLADMMPLVLPGAELRAGWMSIGVVGVANVVPSGSNLMQEGVAGMASGGGLMMAGSMVITGVMWAGVTQGVGAWCRVEGGTCVLEYGGSGRHGAFWPKLNAMQFNWHGVW